MDLNNIWNDFLEKIKTKIKKPLYQTWFEKTKLVEKNDEYAVIQVPLLVHKTFK